MCLGCVNNNNYIKNVNFLTNLKSLHYFYILCFLVPPYILMIDEKEITYIRDELNNLLILIRDELNNY